MEHGECGIFSVLQVSLQILKTLEIIYFFKITKFYNRNINLKISGMEYETLLT